MKILIADDHRIMRDCLKSTLESAGFSVVGCAANGHEALQLARELKPDVVTMDISMPELDGIVATRRLVRELPALRVLGLSMKADRQNVMAMFAAGAAGYLSKTTASAGELLSAIGSVASGHKYVSPGVAALVLDNAPETASVRPASGRARTQDVSKPLSGRERQVLQLIAEGCSSKQIATRLILAVPTVETHRRQVMNKLGLRSVAELTKYAVREGLSPLD